MILRWKEKVYGRKSQYHHQADGSGSAEAQGDVPERFFADMGR